MFSYGIKTKGDEQMNTYDLIGAFHKLYNFEEQAEKPEILEQIKKEIEAAGGYATEKLENIAKTNKMLKQDEQAIKAEIDRLQAKKKALENKQKFIKSLAESLLKAMHKEKVKTPLFTIYTAVTKSVNITDEGLIDDFYKERIETVKIDKKKLKADFEAGEDIDGAELIEKSGVRFR